MLNRQRRCAAVIVITMACAFASGCSTASRAEQKRYDASFLELFDTVSHVIGHDTDKEAFTVFAQSVHDELAVYHNFYDIYTTSDAVASLKTINDSAGIAPVEVDQRIIDMLKAGREMYAISGSKTNIALGAVLRVWHKYREEGIDDPLNSRLPPMDELREAAQHVDINDMIIDEQLGTVYIADPLMSLDVGALAKGYATEMAARSIEQSGRDNVMLSIGGNVRAVGAKPDGDHWAVGVQNPDMGASNELLFTLNIDSMSVVTSGAYQRYYTVDGVRYHHIIDPDTLMPAAYYVSVTIVAADSGLADGLSTALFCMPLEDSRALAESMDGVEACWVMPDGSIEMTGGFSAFIKK